MTRMAAGGALPGNPHLIDARRLWVGEGLYRGPLALVDLDATREWPGDIALPPCPVIGLGDAAHPITPNVGQGACMAIEDAATLAKLLPGAADLAGAFRAYEAVRGPRTAYIARQSRRIGMIGQWENPWVVRGRNFVTKLVLARPPDVQLNAVYAYEV